MIFDQDLKPGEKIRQEKLAEKLGVSRSPLQKALQRLESELLIESIPRRGVIVKMISSKELIDVFELRAVLEGLSARLAASRLTPVQIEKLKSCFEPFRNKTEIDYDEYAKADRYFHDQIMKWSGNEVVTRLEVLSNVHMNAYQAGLFRAPEETLPEHFAIIKALEKQDGNLAEKLMRKHIQLSLEKFRNDK